jgi:alpha-D-ribose 1-methylphosphonate 5-triphosphate diphosphatase
MSEFLITNARIVTRHEVIDGDLLIRDGKIEAVEPNRRPSAVAGALDAGGDFILPGLIELHTDNMERASSPRPGVRWPIASAVVAHDAEMAACGVTTVFDALALGDIRRGATRVQLLDEIVAAVTAMQAEGVLRADHRLHLRCELSFPTLRELVDALAHHPLVGLMSLMDHTPGQRQFVSLDAFKLYYKGKYGMSEEAVESFIIDRRRDQQKYAPDNHVAVIAAAKEKGIRLASHDDATAAHIAEAVEAGVTIAEFPTTLEAGRAARAAGLYILAGAPNVVRGGSHSGNVAATDFAREGLLDILSSDYVPASLLNGAFRLAKAEAITLPDAIATVTATPAAAMGLTDRGSIAPSLRADLVRVKLVGGMPVARATWRIGQRVA